mmetsp:Transcript_53020/g.146524  ORF Transcript_53020/g.146524 Transcript_53020/m.146524 type:complete len:117 (+) Transcript_53020:198-548(+)
MARDGHTASFLHTSPFPAKHALPSLQACLFPAHPTLVCALRCESDVIAAEAAPPPTRREERGSVARPSRLHTAGTAQPCVCCSPQCEHGPPWLLGGSQEFRSSGQPGNLANDGQEI